VILQTGDLCFRVCRCRGACIAFCFIVHMVVPSSLCNVVCVCVVWDVVLVRIGGLDVSGLMGGGVEGEIRGSLSFRCLWFDLGCASFYSSLFFFFLLCQGYRADSALCDGQF